MNHASFKILPGFSAAFLTQYKKEVLGYVNLIIILNAL